MRLNQNATERLTVAAICGVLIGLLFWAITGNYWSVTAGGGIMLAIELVHLRLQERKRRRLRPVVRAPRCSHVRIREGRAA